MKNAYPVMVSLTNPDEEPFGADIGSYYVGVITKLECFPFFAKHYVEEVLHNGKLTRYYTTKNGQWICFSITFEDRVEYLVVGKDYYLPYFE